MRALEIVKANAMLQLTVFIFVAAIVGLLARLCKNRSATLWAIHAGMVHLIFYAILSFYWIESNNIETREITQMMPQLAPACLLGGAAALLVLLPVVAVRERYSLHDNVARYYQRSGI